MRSKWDIIERRHLGRVKLDDLLAERRNIKQTPQPTLVLLLIHQKKKKEANNQYGAIKAFLSARAVEVPPLVRLLARTECSCLLYSTWTSVLCTLVCVF